MTNHANAIVQAVAPLHAIEWPDRKATRAAWPAVMAAIDVLVVLAYYQDGPRGQAKEELATAKQQLQFAVDRVRSRPVRRG